MQPTLIIVNGMPGTGKTTLSKKLAADLQLPLLGKDMLKEFLFDTICTGDLAWSQQLGATTFEMLYAFIDAMLSHGTSIIIECPFNRAFAVPRFADTLKHSGARLIEVYCTTDPAVRRQRFIDCGKRGERHPGHIDHAYYNSPEPTQYEPLALGELIKVDTTAFGDAEYKALLAHLNALLATR